ncbi:MAG: cell wall metabolism sensor histidine kinase WalK [Armatimonadetes bacterium]|nr:cell wall metabolism sensor histidine kinase WalK [Armatimonadota bacterium]
MGRSLFGRLLVSFVGIILVTLVVTSLVLSWLFSSFYYSTKERELVSQGGEIAGLLSASLGEQADREKTLNSLTLRSLRAQQDTRIMIVGREVLDPSLNPGPAPYPLPPSPLEPADGQKLLQGRAITWQRQMPRSNQTILTAAVPFTYREQVAGAILLSTPVADIRATISAVRRLIFYSAGVAVLLAIIPAYCLSRSISRPIKQMSALTMEMAKGNFRRQIPVTSRDEIGRLAEHFNRLGVELEQTINNLSREKTQNENILVNLAEGVIATDLAGKTTLLNPAAEHLLGLDQKKALNQDLASFEGCQPLGALFKEVMETGEQRSGEFDLPGKKIVLFALVAPLRGRDGTAYGAVGVIKDVTEARKLEQLRRDFIADVSHEIRTPLTSIQGFTEALLDEVTADKAVQAEYLKVIHQESLRLGRLLNELLDLARLESGKVRWDLNPIDVPELFAGVLLKLKPQIEEKSLCVEQEIPPGFPALPGNEERIEQVLINLVQNAIRFSPPGGMIKMQASFSGEEATISVSDQGPGIPEEDLPHIWERFYRVEKSRSRALGGTGLGLAIVRQIVELHGGKVSVSSREGAGSTFSFTLPLAPAQNNH